MSFPMCCCDLVLPRLDSVTLSQPWGGPRLGEGGRLGEWFGGSTVQTTGEPLGEAFTPGGSRSGFISAGL